MEYPMWKLTDNNGNVKSVAAIVEFVQWDLKEAEKEFGMGSHKIERMTTAEWFDYQLNAIRNTTHKYIVRLQCTQDCIEFDTDAILHGVNRRLDKVLIDFRANQAYRHLNKALAGCGMVIPQVFLPSTPAHPPGAPWWIVRPMPGRLPGLFHQGHFHEPRKARHLPSRHRAASATGGQAGRGCKNQPGRICWVPGVGR